jgi:hypothetical protein
MRAIALLALHWGGLAAASELNTYWPSAVPWNYQIGYAAMPGKACTSGLSEPLEVGFISDASVDGVPLSNWQCYYRCSVLGLCTGAESGDTAAVFSVCGDLQLLKKACDAAPGCKGIHKDQATDRGFLLKASCQEEALQGQLVDSSKYDYYAKMDPESSGVEGCPMGMAVLASGLSDLATSCAELDVKEQYNPVTEKTFGTGCADITWSPNGCGWLVRAPAPPAPAPSLDFETCPARTCYNHPAEANWIAGLEQAEYDPEICTRTEPWLAVPGYCRNALWKALCPEQCPEVNCTVCSSWLNDNAAAAAVLTDMLGLDATGGECAALLAANMCEDPVVGVVCQGTCPPKLPRRLNNGAEAHLSSARDTYGTHFRRTLSTIEAEVVAAGGRRLDSHRMSMYGSWDPTRPLAEGICSDMSVSVKSPPGYLLLDTTSWLDWYSWMTVKHELSITPGCPDQPTYFTDSNKYCDLNNVNIMNIPVGGVVTQELYDAINGDLCWTKCSSAAPDGTFCDGFDAKFNAYSNALCVPRSTCERYCDELGGMCSGFEMHKAVPRCYLVTDICLNAVSSVEFNQVSKAMAPNRYYTHHNSMCNLPAEDPPLIPPQLGRREDCESTCNINLDCAGFDYTPLNKTCEFRSIVRSSFDPASFCSGGMMTFASTTETLNTLTAKEGTHYVEKMMKGVSVESPWSLPCEAVVSASPGYVPGTAVAAYTRTLAADCGAPLQDEVCYMSPTKSHRLVWGNQAKFSSASSAMYMENTTGITRRCSGWVLEAAGEGGGYEPQYATYFAEGFDCPSAPTMHSLNIPNGYNGMYRWKPVVDDAVSMNYVCKSYPMCGTLQTCVLAKNRFYSEMAIQLTKIVDSTLTVTASPYTFISDTPSYQELLDPVTFRPKTLISVEMAILFVAKLKAQYGAELYRNVPGDLRIKIAELGKGVSTAVIKMVSASGTTLFGKAYEIPRGYEPWYTDVVRVEKFGPTGVIDAAGPVIIDFYAPTAPNLMVVAFGKDGTEIARLPASLVPGSPGYWRVAAAVSGDYVGTTESPCPAIPFGETNPKPAFAEDGLTCSKFDAGAECTVTCMATYVPSGVMTCALGKWSTVTCDKVPGYEAETQLFRLSHRSRLDYGWRIRKIMAFTDAECTSMINPNFVAIKGPSESYLDMYPAEDSKFSIRTNNIDGKNGVETKCLRSPSPCQEFWSKDLNANPYSVDETHGGAVSVDFTVDSELSVQCVQVVSRTLTGTAEPGTPRQYYPEEMTLHRGFFAEPGSDEPLVYSMISKMGWTTFWTATAAGSEKRPQGLYTTFTTSCGKKSTRIFGESLKIANSVPSPCHCRQHCIDEINNGCVSWNYHVPTKDCYLQSTIKSAPKETCEEFVDWIAGDTGVRIDGISPTTVSPGAAFSLTVTGTNLPTVAIKGATPARQRIKIVEKDAVCADSVVSAFVDGIGCTHPYFCTSKPSSTNASSATWSGLKIFGAETDKHYTVCYNKGLTHDRYEWVPVGEISVPKTPFVFTTLPPILKRNTPSFNLTVERPPMTEYSATTGWAIKLVKSHLDCEEESDEKLVLNPPSMHVTVDTATFPNISVYDVSGLVFADVGLYKVCFAKDGFTYTPIPSKTGEAYLEIGALEGDSSQTRAVHTYQMLSGKTNAVNSFLLTGSKLYLPSDSGLGFFAGDDCTGSSVFSAIVDDLASTEGGYLFTGTVPAIAAGKYTMCYCDDQSSGGDVLLIRSSKSKYEVTEDYVCEVGLTYSALTSAAKDDVCTVKCAKGCAGAGCFCDSFDLADYVASPDGGTSYPLCVSAPKCKEYCSAVDSCTGFDYDPATKMCTLLAGDCTALAFKEGSQFWNRIGNTSACAADAGYDTVVGAVTLTTRADVGVDWVLTPGETASIEVIGTGMDWQKDRLMLIDCTGTCGVSGPTPSVTAGPKSQMQYNHWVAVRPDFSDQPHDDTEVPTPKPPPVEKAETVLWRNSPESYCAGNNMDVASIPDVKTHQCFAKCDKGLPCSGAACFCDGLVHGYDGPDSQALCLDEASCKKACAGLDDCFGIDMDASKNRCFLNSVVKGPSDTFSCEEYLVSGRLTKLKSYSLIYKQQLPETRRATAVPPGAPQRGLLPTFDILGSPVDTGKSWDQILRFNNITFEAGGKFKACFCDYQTLSPGTYCKRTSDYTVEVGTVHVSGVSCLVEEEKFRRGTCVEQFHGGLRCYPGAAPALTVPDAGPTPAPTPAKTTTVIPDVSSFCLYGPEEETRDDPLCNL